MKLTLINTFHLSGGAAVACRRLLRALRKYNIEAHLLVGEKNRPDNFVAEKAVTFLQKKKAFLQFALDRVYFALHEKNKEVRFAFSPANIGTDISKHPLVQEADILHLHWVTFGFLSLQSIEKLVKLNKPIVWTLHDMWPFTGGCHYSGSCTKYETHCHSCPFLRNPHPRDLSYHVFEKKIKLFAQAPITVVACSEWLAQIARQSHLFRNFPVYSIPNPIDTEQFGPIEKNASRQQLNLSADKKLILFGAMKVHDPRKGFSYLKKALQILSVSHPETAQSVALIVFGKATMEDFALLPFPVYGTGQLSSTEELVQVYNAADIFVLPSLEDNLPNTIMESMACGTPVVAFDIGGIPEMINHLENGYLANYCDAADLAKGIYHILFNINQKDFSYNARQKVLEDYAQEIVAQKYKHLYNQLTE